MKRFLLLLAAAGAVTACGGTATNSSSAGTTAGAGTQAPATSTADVSVGSTSLGQVLVDKNGRTLYYFTPEQGSTLVCDTGSCVATWPLLVVSGTPSAGQGVTGQLTVAMTPDGKSEVVYNGWPLHTYAADSSAGDTKGQGVGGKWFAATPSLTAAGGGSASAPASSTATYSPY